MSSVDAPPRRGQALLAWFVVAGVVVFVLYRYALRPPSRDRAAWLVPVRSQARYLVGLRELNFPGSDGNRLYQQARNLDRGTYGQRLRFAILAGELVGPGEALDRLAALRRPVRDEEPDAPEQEQALQPLLLRLYKGYKNDPATIVLTDDEQNRLRTRLGWFGDLALAPEEGDEDARAAVLAPARRVVVAMLVVAGVLILSGLLGLVLLLVVVVIAAMGWLRAAMPGDTGHGGIYAETFALYMLLFMGLSFLLRLVDVPDSISLGIGGVAMILSLGALAWPVLRGVSWRQVARDIGWTGGDRPWLEPFLGIGAWLAVLPMLLMAVLLMYGILYLRRIYFGGDDPLAPGVGPTHPIIGVALQRDPWLWIQVFVVACILAPVVEETMFRGVLYRHLRDLTAGWRRWLGVLFSALASGFVFAVIHPQGWLGVPVLMTLAVMFAVLREWRQSLISPMVAHGVNNAAATLTLLATSS